MHSTISIEFSPSKVIVINLWYIPFIVFIKTESKHRMVLLYVFVCDQTIFYKQDDFHVHLTTYNEQIYI